LAGRGSRKINIEVRSVKMEQIFYRSTRGNGKSVLSSEAIIKGIAEDGGLFVPHHIPSVGNSLKDMENMNYKQLSYSIMSRFFTDFSRDELEYCIENAYNNKFDTDEIAPVKEAGGVFYLELFHGPTLAFKDMALSILPHLLKTSVKKQGVHKEIVILTATSGDTGKAALEGFTDIEGTKIIVFFPEDGVSEIQKRQMTTHCGSNTYVVGIKGNFDDAQNGVKEIFADKEFAKLLNSKNYMLSSANSINIGRLVPQIVYYFHAYNKVCQQGKISTGDKINVVVPTGNFGNILAAYYAKEMGLPINKLICASNENRVLYDFISTGLYDKMRDFITTISPSMDILISSNLERLLYSISGENPDTVNSLMKGLNTKGKYEITPEMKSGLKDFYGGYASEIETRKAIKEVFQSYGYLMDTHTAVGYVVYNKYKLDTEDSATTIISSTASPYKFTNAVMTSIDEKYSEFDDFQLIKEMNKLSKVKIPSAIEDIQYRPIIHNSICEKKEMKAVVAQILKL